MKKIIILTFLLILPLGLISCKSKENNLDENTNENEEIDLEALPYFKYLSEDNTKILIKVKDYGEMKLELFDNLAPITVNNFKNYILSTNFKNSSFHRIIKDFMIQGGIVEESYEPITGEFNLNGIFNDLKHSKGVISMARTNQVNSATSQFFIVHKDSPHLDGSYAGFGGLISGFDCLEKIANVKTNYNDSPKNKVTILSIEII